MIAKIMYFRKASCGILLASEGQAKIMAKIMHSGKAGCEDNGEDNALRKGRLRR